MWIFACTYLHRVLFVEAQRRHWIPWNLSYRELWASMWYWEQNSGLLQKFQVFLMTEPTLQILYCSYIHLIVNNGYNKGEEERRRPPAPLKITELTEMTWTRFTLESNGQEIINEIKWWQISSKSDGDLIVKWFIWVMNMWRWCSGAV